MAVGTVRLTTSRNAKFDCTLAETREFRAMDALEILKVSRQHDQNVVIRARHQVALKHGRALHDRRLKRFESFVALGPVVRSLREAS